MDDHHQDGRTAADMAQPGGEIANLLGGSNSNSSSSAAGEATEATTGAAAASAAGGSGADTGAIKVPPRESKCPFTRSVKAVTAAINTIITAPLLTLAPFTPMGDTYTPAGPAPTPATAPATGAATATGSTGTATAPVAVATVSTPATEGAQAAVKAAAAAAAAPTSPAPSVQSNAPPKPPPFHPPVRNGAAADQCPHVAAQVGSCCVMVLCSTYVRTVYIRTDGWMDGGLLLQP